MIGPNDWIRMGVPIALSAGVFTAAASYVTFAPACAFWGPVVARGNSRQRMVALTFDDGPHPGGTDRVLDALGELGVSATFFVVGRNVDRHPDLVRRMRDEGHGIGNHSYDHCGWSFLRGPDYWRGQIERTDRAIEQAIGLRPNLFRPPLGMKTWHSMRAARARHITVNWSLRGLDGIGTTSQKILRRLVPRARPGDILLLHDGVSPQSRRDPSATVDAIRPLVAGLRERRLEPVRLEELIGFAPPGPLHELSRRDQSKSSGM